MKLEFENKFKELEKTKQYKNSAIGIYKELAKNPKFSKLAKEKNYSY